jgi:hypothetical protein
MIFICSFNYYLAKDYARYVLKLDSLKEFRHVPTDSNGYCMYGISGDQNLFINLNSSATYMLIDLAEIRNIRVVNIKF